MALEERAFSLREKWAALRKRRHLILLTTAACALVGGLFSLWQPKIFRATTFLLVTESRITDPDSRNPNFVYFELLRSYEAFLNTDYLIQKTIEKFRLQKPPYQFSVDALRRQHFLSVELQKNTRLLEVRVEFPEAHLAADIANSFAANAVEFNQDMNAQDTQQTRSDIKKQMDAAALELEVSRNNLLEFNRNSQLEELRESVWNLLEGRSKHEARMTELNIELSHSQAKRDGLLANQMREIDSEILELKAELQALQKTMTLNNQKLALLLKDKATKESLFDRLSLEHKLASENYAGLKQKYQEAFLSVGAKTVDLRVVSPAIVPQKPIRPRVPLNVLLAAIFGLLASTFLTLLLHNLEWAKAMSSGGVGNQNEEKLHEIKRRGKGV